MQNAITYSLRKGVEKDGRTMQPVDTISSYKVLEGNKQMQDGNTYGLVQEVGKGE